MDQRRLIILGLCTMLPATGASLARGDEPRGSGEAELAYRIVYRINFAVKNFTTGKEKFSTAQATETAARRLIESRAVVEARAEAFDPKTGKTVTAPRPEDSGAVSARSSPPPASAGRSQRGSYPPGERPVPTDGDGPASSRSSRESRPFINLGGVSVTNDFIGRRRPHSPRNRGWLVTQSESKDGGSSVISTGKRDPGGQSYGTFQFRSKREDEDTPSNVERFVNRYYRKDFTGEPVNSPEFMETWLRLSLEEPDSFRKNEEEFLRKENIDPMLRQLEKRVDLDLGNRSDALQEVLWSVAVQHGPGHGASLVERAMKGKNADDLNDRDLIAAIYTERLRKENGKLVYFKRDGNPTGEEIRFAREQNEALAALAGEPTTRQELQRRAKKAQAETESDVQTDARKRAADEAKNRASNAAHERPRMP
jgi:hypothetical protein